MAKYATSEEVELKKRKELLAQRRKWMEEKHPCLVDKTRQEMFQLALRALYINYISGECRKLVCHNPITFRLKYE